MSMQDSWYENKKIKIFVSHTAGSDNETIDNPLFVNVIGGAVFDKRGAKINGMLCDNTGDNISSLNRHFSEYSVIYWAWKNQEADYYGLCHYRRFLSFADHKLKASGLRQVCFDGMTEATLKEAGLNDEEEMRRIIGEYDMIVPYEHDVVKHDCKDNRIKSVKQFWLRYHASYLKESEFDLILELFKEHNPEYYQDALEYMEQLNFRGFNCFVMKRELFNEYCEYAFPMLFGFEEKCDRTHNSTLTNRNTGYAGEWFFSIFVYHKLKEGKCRIKEAQLVVFSDTVKESAPKPFFKENNLPIAFAVSDTNAHRVAATMQSIIDRKDPETKLDFILLNSGNNTDRWRNHLLKEELSALTEMQKDYEDVSIRTYNPKKEIGRLELRRHVDVKLKERYYGVLLPFILKEYDKALYISDTMLCRGDLRGALDLLPETNNKETEPGDEPDKPQKPQSGIFATYDLNYIAMANGFIKNFRDDVTNRLGISDPYSIFSSDIIAYDLEKARSSFDLETLVNKILEKEDMERQLTTTEALNLCYDGAIEPLPQVYNAYLNLEPDYFATIEYIPEELDKGTDNSKLINLRGMHQVTRDLKLNVVKEYLGYARKTPFYEEHLLDASYEAIFRKEKKYVKRVHHKQLNEEYYQVHKTSEQAMADKLFPLGSPIRNVIDTALPKDSKRQKMVKKVIKDITKK